MPDAPEVVVGESLAEGLKLGTDQRFAVVLLDLSLPDSHGLETVRKAVAALQGGPVIALTGLYDERVGRDILSAGDQNYLVKGRLAPDSLLHALRGEPEC